MNGITKDELFRRIDFSKSAILVCYTTYFIDEIYAFHFNHILHDYGYKLQAINHVYKKIILFNIKDKSNITHIKLIKQALRSKINIRLDYCDNITFLSGHHSLIEYAPSSRMNSLSNYRFKLSSNPM